MIAAIAGFPDEAYDFLLSSSPMDGWTEPLAVRERDCQNRYSYRSSNIAWAFTNQYEYAT